MSLLFLALVLVMAVVAIQVHRAVGVFVAENASVIHTLGVKQQLTRVIAALRDAEADQRAYLLSANPARLGDYYGALPRIDEQTLRLQELLDGNAEQAPLADELAKALAHRQESMVAILGAYQMGGVEAARKTLPFGSAREDDRHIDTLVSRMQQHEDGLLAHRRQKTGSTADLTRQLTVGAIAGCVLMLGLAFLLILREQHRRLRSEARTRESYAELANSLGESQRLSLSLRQLSELGEMLQGCRSVSEAVSGLPASLSQLFPTCAGSLNLINPAQDMVESVAQWGELAPECESWFAPDDCWALRRGNAFAHTAGSSGFRCRHIHATENPQGGYLCVPLMAQGEVFGTLLLMCAQPITQSVREVALATSEQISLALANLRLQETLRSQSLRDPLTGLFNRRYLDNSLQRALRRAERREFGLAVLMLDIDHFKRFNDSHGHEAGDALLMQFGALIEQLVRSDDIACRYGGEEFTIVMQQVDAQQALARANELCEAVRSLEVKHRNEVLEPVSVSIGIAIYSQHGSTAEALLRSADAALYAAKAAGRDRAEVAVQEDPAAAANGATPLWLADRTVPG